MKHKKPRIIAVFGQKGGSGKTTICVHLAVAAQQDGEHVGVLDVDPQRSAYAWAQFRPKDKPPAIASCRSDQMSEYFAAAQKTELSLLLIDTAPHASVGVYDAVKHADFLIMPCRPSILDLSAIEATVRIAESAKVPGAFVLTGVPPRSPEVVAAREALESFSFPVCPVQIGHRTAFVRALASGQSVTEFEPSSVAADEMHQLWKWVKKAI
jgi:chromosome partitioning protein